MPLNEKKEKKKHCQSQKVGRTVQTFKTKQQGFG